VGGAQIFLEFRQLAGALHAVAVDDDRDVAFQIAMLGGMQVDHELTERAMQMGQLTTKHGETRTRQLGAGIAIEPAMTFAQLDVILDGEVEAARGAPAALLDVVVLVLADRHGLVRQVRDTQRNGGQPGLHVGQRLLVGLELVAQTTHFGQQLGDNFALGQPYPAQSLAWTGVGRSRLGAYAAALGQAWCFLGGYQQKRDYRGSG
jgi:hypothetical protein